MLSEQISELRRGVAEVLIDREFTQLIESGKRLTIKAGFDPTAPDLHLGHTVILNKMRQFQERGHSVVFLIGDFTGLIGDPTGRSVTRPPLSEAQVKENSQTYCDQVFKILDPQRTRIEFNSTWMNKLNAADLVRLAGKYTVARMLEREDFRVRHETGRPIAIHEFLYPLIQGYDSVELNADIELGGTDQKFNLLIGRHLQEVYGQRPQVVVTMPLLEGLDGVQKMSKSLNNYIGVSESPGSMFGKLMSISDTLMWRYFELLSFRNQHEIEKLTNEVTNGRNPRDIKYKLARELVARFHDSQAAVQAQTEFIARFTNREVPADITEISVKSDAGKIDAVQLLKRANLVESTSAAHRLVAQGAVRFDDVRVDNAKLSLQAGTSLIVRVGKRRLARIRIS
ncbi:MAG: tyrosine--tRNA ligase [Gammaproteobacteria bacterium]|nr:tyrosine--tRNA ligase [Gammaproteobacteria bacterium]